jgi:hypothetical protein
MGYAYIEKSVSYPHTPSILHGLKLNWMPRSNNNQQPWGMWDALSMMRIVMKSPLVIGWFLLYLPNVPSTFFSRIS